METGNGHIPGLWMMKTWMKTSSKHPFRIWRFSIGGFTEIKKPGADDVFPAALESDQLEISVIKTCGTCPASGVSI